MGAAAAVVLMKERQMIEAFERAGATAPERARTPAELGADMQGVGWRRLQERAIVRAVGDGRFYLDREVWQAMRRSRRRLLLVMLALILAAVLVMAMLGSWFS